MASDDWAASDALTPEISALIEDVREADLIAVLRLLESLHASKPRIGDAARLDDEYVRLSQSVSLGFQGSALHDLSHRESARHTYKLTVNSPGLFGSSGALPLHYSEFANAREQHHGDGTFKAFVDLFHHRLLSLFYKASVQFDPACCFDHPQDNTYGDVVGTLCGLMPLTRSEGDGQTDYLRHFMPGWFSDSACSPDGLRAILTDRFEVEFSIKEWVGVWLELPESSRVCLKSQSTSALGQATCLGRRAWSRRAGFRISSEPLDWSDFSAFKPGGTLCRKLYDTVHQYVGHEWDWQLQLNVRSDAIRPMQLNSSNALGLDSWIPGSKPHANSSASVVFNQRQIRQRFH